MAAAGGQPLRDGVRESIQSSGFPEICRWQLRHLDDLSVRAGFTRGLRKCEGANFKRPGSGGAEIRKAAMPSPHEILCGERADRGVVWHDLVPPQRPLWIAHEPHGWKRAQACFDFSARALAVQ